MNKPLSRGPRPGRPDTRGAILEAARARFVADGYDAVTLRAIAADAGVDVALVSYYFKSKRGLFGTAMALPVNPADVVQALLAGARDHLAERMLRTLLMVWDGDGSGPALRTMAVAAAGDTDLTRVVREALSREIIDAIANALDGPRAPERAAAFTTQMTGVIFARYVLALEPIASMSPDEVVRHLVPSLQLALQGPPGARSARRTTP